MSKTTLMTEYCYACRDGCLNTVKKCVEQGVDINGEYLGSSPFRLACELGHQEIVKYLIENNADIFHPSEYGLTGLTHASRNGHTKIAKLLLIQYSSLDFIRFKDYWRQTALMYAAINGHVDIVRLLLLYDPSQEHILIKNDEGKTAIDLAETEKIRELLKNPAQLSKTQTKRAKGQEN